MTKRGRRRAHRSEDDRPIEDLDAFLSALEKALESDRERTSLRERVLSLVAAGGALVATAVGTILAFYEGDASPALTSTGQMITLVIATVAIVTLSVVTLIRFSTRSSARRARRERASRAALDSWTRVSIERRSGLAHDG